MGEMGGLGEMRGMGYSALLPNFPKDLKDFKDLKDPIFNCQLSIVNLTKRCYYFF